MLCIRDRHSILIASGTFYCMGKSSSLLLLEKYGKADDSLTLCNSWLFHLVVNLQWNCSDDAVTKIRNIRRTGPLPLCVAVLTAAKCH